VLSNGYGSNSPLTPSARISALNIVSDLLRKVGVSYSFSPFQLLCLPFVAVFPRHLLCRLSLHRLWSQSSLPAGTSPRTRKPGRRMLSTTATCWMQTQPATRRRSIRHILTKREYNFDTSDVIAWLLIKVQTERCGDWKGWKTETCAFCPSRTEAVTFPALILGNRSSFACK